MRYVFRALGREPWAQALDRLSGATLGRNAAEVEDAYAELYAALSEAGHADLYEAAAAGLLYGESVLAQAALSPPEGLLVGARRDLSSLLNLLRRDWHGEVADIVGDTAGNAVSARASGSRTSDTASDTVDTVPPLEQLSVKKDRKVQTLAQTLCTADAESVLRALLGAYRKDGSGDLARFPAFRWSGGALHGVLHPAWAEARRLVGLERQLERLYANTEAFLCGRGGQHALLYGPRGSGKSTVLRSLGGRYAEAGLRFVEVVPESLTELPTILETLRGRPHFYLLFVDDLSFEAGSRAYGPLKSLLEGSLGGRPANVLVYATSNRRHLVTERFSDRPDPSNDDVHAWDTQHERLALADRFGLVLTFPDATQRRYLEIVRGLAARDAVADSDLDTKAVRFAEWGNGYSGRTAQQFVEALKSGLT